MNKFELGENIRKRRKYIGKSQEEIAKKISVSKSQISKWENEISYPSMTDFQQLSDALNIHPVDLIEGRTEEDFVKRKEKKEKIGIWIIGLLIVMILCLVVNIFVTVYKLKDFDEMYDYRYDRNCLYSKESEDGTWEIRQIIKSKEDAVWADVITYERDGIIVDYELKQIIFTGDETEKRNDCRLEDDGTKLEIYVYYYSGNTGRVSFIEITPTKFR